MSENLLRLIPTNPSYIPDIDVQQKALDMLKLFFPHADAVSVKATIEIRFIDAGANLEKIVCPICGRKIDINWWIQTMDYCYVTTNFVDLSVTTPCCSSVSSLNDLQYVGPAGFARFSLEVLNPSNIMSADSILLLEDTLQCELREIWAHY